MGRDAMYYLDHLIVNADNVRYEVQNLLETINDLEKSVEEKDLEIARLKEELDELKPYDFRK